MTTLSLTVPHGLSLSPLTRFIARIFLPRFRDEGNPSRRLAYRFAMDDASIALYGYEPKRLNRISARLNLY